MLTSFKNIAVLVFDIDGVLTDGSLLIAADGTAVRKMHVRDGYALQLAIKSGYKVVAMSGSYSPPVKERLEKLGIPTVYMQVENKLEKLKALLAELNMLPENVLYMGDDIPDLEVMQYCGLACCPADAVAEIRNVSKYISPLKGGEGCVRDVIEKVLKLQGKWIADTHITSA